MQKNSPTPEHPWAGDLVKGELVIARWRAVYASEELTLVKMCDTEVAMWLTPEIIESAINVHSSPYSTRSWPSSPLARACNFTNNVRSLLRILLSPLISSLDLVLLTSFVHFIFRQRIKTGNAAFAARGPSR